MFEAVILAAGLGTRLRPYTLQLPKPLLAVQGKPILEWLLRALPRSVTKVYLVVHYLSQQIEEWLRQQTNIFQWQTVRQAEPRGSGDALMTCRDYIRSERFLVLNGDDLYAAEDLDRLAKHMFGLLTYPVGEPRLFGVVRTRPDGTLDQLVEKPNWPGPQLANIGAYVLPQAIFDVVPQLSPRGEYEITSMIQELAQRMPCQVLEAQFWHPISTVEAWEAAQGLDLKRWIPAA